MALSTRSLLRFKPLLPEVLVSEIQSYLPPAVFVEELHASIQVSKAWRLANHKEELWKNALANEEDQNKKNKLHERLFDFLITAIQKKQYDRIYRYIAIGVQINKRYSGDFSVPRSRRRYFRNPTVLLIAASQLSGQEGTDIVRLLLHCGADPLAMSIYVKRASDRYRNSVQLEPHKLVFPSKFARDDSTKILLHFAEFEQELSMPGSVGPSCAKSISHPLENASIISEEVTRAYVAALMLQKKAGTPFQGVQRELKFADQEKLTNDQYLAASNIGFFQRHGGLCLAVAAGVYFSFILYGSTIHLGAFLVGLFTSAAVSPALALMLGAIVVGLISGIAYTLLKKAWRHYHPVNNPLRLTQQLQPSQKGLFSKPGPSIKQNSPSDQDGLSAVPSVG